MGVGEHMRSLSVEAEKIKSDILSECKISNTVDRLILHTGLEALADMRRIERILERNGLTIGDREQMRAHPLLPLLRDFREQFLTVLKTFSEIIGKNKKDDNII